MSVILHTSGAKTRAGVGGVLIAVLALSMQMAPVGAASTSFGAKLNSSSQPANAEGGRRCDDDSDIPSGSACSWVATEAHRNAGRHKAPRTYHHGHDECDTAR